MGTRLLAAYSIGLNSRMLLYTARCYALFGWHPESADGKAIADYLLRIHEDLHTLRELLDRQYFEEAVAATRQMQQYMFAQGPSQIAKDVIQGGGTRFLKLEQQVASRTLAAADSCHRLKPYVKLGEAVGDCFLELLPEPPRRLKNLPKVRRILSRLSRKQDSIALATKKRPSWLDDAPANVSFVTRLEKAAVAALRHEADDLDLQVQLRQQVPDITLNGRRYPLNHNQALIVASLVGAQGRLLNGGEIQEGCPTGLKSTSTGSSRPAPKLTTASISREIQKLPDEVRARIVCKRGHGGGYGWGVSMTHTQRVATVLSAGQPDRAAFSLPCYFEKSNAPVKQAVDAYVKHYKTWNPDILVMTRAFPFRNAAKLILSPYLVSPDIDSLFSCELKLLEAVRRDVGEDVFIVPAIPNAALVLASLISQPKSRAISQPGPLKDWICSTRKETPRLVTTILTNVCSTLCFLARRCLRAGANGVFLMVRDDYFVDLPGFYEKAIRPIDLEVLKAVSGATLNILQIQGRPIEFEEFGRYPVDALSWGDKGPRIADCASSLKPAIFGGIGNLAAPASRIARHIRYSVSQAGAHPIIIAPGEILDLTGIPKESLAAVKKSAGRT